MKTSHLYIISSILAIIGVRPSFAESFPNTILDNITYSYNETKDCAIVTSSPKTLSGEITLPNQITFSKEVKNTQTGATETKTKTATLKEIGSSAFSYNEKITSITANTIEVIGQAAFQSCTSLKTAKVGNTLKTIGERAFSECSALENVNLPDGLTSIGNYAFQYCSKLFSGEASTLAIPSTFTSAGKWAFANSGVRQIDYRSSTDIPESMFRECTNLLSIKFNSNIKTIGANAFMSCTSLASVEIPNNCTELGKYAFSRCSGLTTVLLKNQLKTIGDQAFERCSSITELSFPEGFADLTIGNKAFERCTGIKSITFKKSTKITFGTEVFTQMSKLERLYLAEGIVSLGSRNFNTCPNLKNIELEGSETGVKPNLPSTISGLDACFINCTSLTSVDLPAPGNTTFVVSGSFSGCQKLKFVTIDPDNNNYLFDNCFTNIDSLVDVVKRPYKPGTTVSRSARSSQGSISIINGALNYCPKLERIDAPFTVGIGGGLYNCTKMIFDEYTLPYTEEVPTNAIPGHVKKAILKETVRVLNEYAISNVDEINIPDSLRVMHMRSLNLKNITELTLPDSLSDIYAQAIYCPLLEKLTVLNPEPPTYHPHDWIENITDNDSQVTLYVPNGSAKAYQNAEGWNKFKEIIELEKSEIGNLESDVDVSINVTDGRLNVTGCDSISVYNMLGTLVYTGHPDGMTTVVPGIYIVRAGKITSKLTL